MWFSTISESWSCMLCRELPIKDWVEHPDGTLKEVKMRDRINELNARDGLTPLKED